MYCCSQELVLLELVKLAFQIDSNLFAAPHVLPIIVSCHFHLKFQRISGDVVFVLLFFFKCKPTVAAACSIGSLSLLFCQVVRLSLSNLPQQLSFADVNVDPVSVIFFLRRQKIADVFFSFSLEFERKTSDLPT